MNVHTHIKFNILSFNSHAKQLFSLKQHLYTAKINLYILIHECENIALVLKL